MKPYMTIRNYNEKEIGIAFRIVGDLIEFNHSYREENSWRPSVCDMDEIERRYNIPEHFEVVWYTEEEYKAMLIMRELIS